MHILLDLDGTLTDPFIGITRSIQHAFNELGLPEPEANDLGWCIGPPLQQSFTTLLEGDAHTAKVAVQHYRNRYREIGYAENELYPDIIEALSGLTECGFHLHLATAKPVVFAQTIIDLFELRPFFLSINGSELDGTRSDKADLIAFILHNQKVKPSETVMIGDRSNDVAGARANGIPALGVLWGYGSKEELTNAGAHDCVENPSQLINSITKIAD